MRILVFKLGDKARILCIWPKNGFQYRTVFLIPWKDLHEFIEYKKPYQINVYSDA
jgi:hypothetical protein